MATTSSSPLRPALRVVPAPVAPVSVASPSGPTPDGATGAGEGASPPPTVSPLARLGSERHPSAARRPGVTGGESGGGASGLADPVDLALRRLQRALDTGSGEVDRLLARPGRRRRRGPAVRIIRGGAA